jgi:hypothetical protein
MLQAYNIQHVIQHTIHTSDNEVVPFACIAVWGWGLSCERLVLIFWVLLFYGYMFGGIPTGTRKMQLRTHQLWATSPRRSGCISG